MDKQRSQDLNPASDDIEEKIKRMLDPLLPDEPTPTIPESSSIKSKKTAKIIAVSSPVESGEADSMSKKLPETPSAPELPTEVLPAIKENSKKVIIPISHDDEIPNKPKTNKSDSKTTSKKLSDTKPEPEVKKISIVDSDDSTEALAEKLNKTIAELDQQNSKTVDKPAESKTTEKLLLDNLQTETETTAQAKQTIPEEQIAESEVISSPSTDKAVEEIVAAEGDELLEIEDAVRDSDEPIKPEKKPRKSLLQKLKNLWAKPNFRWSFFGIVVLLIVGIGLVPNVRYFVLNSAGVRAKSSVIVLDQSTQLPLKNVSVSIGDERSMTDGEGRVNLQKLKLGSTILKIEKRAFASVDKTIVLGLGSNPLGNFSLTPTGSQYSFTVIDYLSGKPVDKAEASSGEASALSDAKGLIKLTIDNRNDEDIEVSINSKTYRTEKFSINQTDNTVREVKLIPSTKHIFVSKRTGRFDIYSVYIDGKQEKLELEGTGKEKADMVLVPHPKDAVVAYVSTRAGQNNSDGFTLSNLILINTDDGTTTNVGASERIQIVQWFGDNLVYVQITAGSSANSPKRYRLVSYNYKENSSKDLASSNYFNDVIAANGKIYYAPASAYQSGIVGLFQINPDGSDQRTVFDQEVWNIFRTSYEDLVLSVQQNWYNYHLGGNSPTKQNSAPPNQVSRVYIANANGKNSVWTDNRDGKGTLLSYDHESKKDTVIKSQSGLELPVRWLNDSTVVYRVKTDQETADYAISLNGGEAVKIGDVTNSGGLDRWNY